MINQMFIDFQNLTRNEIEDIINNNIISCLHAERNRKIMKRRMLDGLTVEELAKEFDLSEQNIYRILCKNEDLLKLRLNK
jgi:DNA-directed RNA polymerase sigma subunit (sigma70/sigma32)